MLGKTRIFKLTFREKKKNKKNETNPVLYVITKIVSLC